jgi:uncharacterized protein YbjT (DUF2867 family)
MVFPGEVWVELDPLWDVWPKLGKVDVVINAVGAIQATKAMPFERVHGGVTEAVLGQREALGWPRVVQISALGADAGHASGFLRSKGVADALLLGGSNAVVLRPSIVCTPGTMLARKIGTLLAVARFSLNKLLVPAGFPATQVQPILGSDLGKAVVAAAFAEGLEGVVELVGPERIPFGEIFRVMAAAQGRKVHLVEVSREIMETFVVHFLGIWFAGANYVLGTSFPGVLNLEQFRLLFQDNVGDVKGVEGLLGRMPGSTWGFWESEARGELTMDGGKLTIDGSEGPGIEGGRRPAWAG